MKVLYRLSYWSNFYLRTLQSHCSYIFSNSQATCAGLDYVFLFHSTSLYKGGFRLFFRFSAKIAKNWFKLTRQVLFLVTYIL